MIESPESNPIPAVPEEAPWRRQHPVACLFHIAGAVRRLLFPIIAGAIAARGPFLYFFLGTMLSVSIGLALIRYFRYRYRFTAEELVVEQGWLYRNVRHIAYEKVQNINILRNPAHRLFGVSGMQLESASGSEAEAVMEALAQREIDELHDRVERAKGETAIVESRVESIGSDGESEEGAEDAEKAVEKPVREERRRILRLGLGELIRHGLVSNRGMVLVAALLGFFFQGRIAEQMLPVLLGWIDRFTRRAPTEIIEGLGPFGWFGIGVGIFLVILSVLALLSVVYSIIRYYGYTLSVDSKQVRAEYGLFTRVAITIPKHRIQLIGFRANPLHRLCRRVSLKVETAGLSGTEENPASLRWLAPILPEREAARVLREVQPEVEWEELEWRSLHPRTWKRMFRVRLIALALAGLFLTWTGGTLALAVLVFVPVAFGYARGYFRYAGWAVTPTAVAFRSGWLVKRQSVVRHSRIQVVSMTRNPFDRRWGMAAVTADTAGSDPAGHSIRIRFMEETAARELTDLLEEKTRTTKFVW